MPARDVIFRIIGEDLFSPAAMKAGGAADTLAAKVNRASAGMLSAGRKMTTHLTLPLVGLGAVAVKSATDFNSAMTRIQTQAGGTARDVRVLSREVMGMKNVQQGPVDLANALYHLKSVGLDNVDAMKALRVSSNLAAVGNANLEDTTNALAGAWRTGIQGAKNFHTAASTVNAIIGAGNMTLSDFNAALGTGILASAKTFGLSLKDVGSALALFTDEGVGSAQAATRLRMSFSLLGAPSGVAAKYLSQIGLNGLKLGADLRKPDGLITAIGDLKKHLDDSGMSAVKQADLLSRAFGGGRSSSAILSMINNFDVLKKKQDQVTNSLGKYNEAVKTQAATPQAQFHRELADLQRAGITLGNVLLPIATSLAKKIADLANGFNNLSPHARSTLVSIGIGLAALGPALTIAGRLVQVFGLLGRAISGVARASRTLPSALRLANAGMSGLLAGQVVSSAAAGSGYGGHTGKALLTLGGSAAAGAATGAIFGGLPGAVVGGAAGAISGTIGIIHHLNTAAQENAQVMQAAMAANARYTEAFKGTVDSLLSSLQAVNGAMGKQYKQQVIGQLGNQGVLSAASNAGLNLKTVVKAALGQTSGAEYNRVVSALGRVNRDAARSFIDMTHAAGGAEKKFELEQAAAGKSIVTHNQLGVSIKQLRDSLNSNNKFLDDNSAAATRNRAVIAANLQALQHARDAEIQHGKSVMVADSAYRQQIGTLAQNLTQMGYNRSAVLNLISSYTHIPKSVLTQVFAKDQASGVISSVEAKLAGIKDRTVSVTVTVGGNLFNAAAIMQKLGPQGYFAPHAAGGKIPPNTKFTVGELGYEAGVSDSMGRVTIFSNAASRAMGVRPAVGYAGGSMRGASLMDMILRAGFRGRAAQIMYGIVMAESGGNRFAHNYNPSTGDNSYGLAQINMLGGLGPARRRQYGLSSNAALYNAATNLRIAYQMSGHGSHFGDWTTYTSGAYRQFEGEANANIRHVGGDYIVGGTRYASLRAAENAQARNQVSAHQARVQAAQARAQARGTAIGAVKAFLDPSNLSSVAGSRAQFQNVISAVRGMHGSADLIKRLTADDKALDDAIRKRVADSARLAKAQANLARARQNLNQETAAVSGATRGAFDITSAGADASGKVAFGAIRASQTQELNIIHAWVRDIKKISKMFGKSRAGRGMVRQLAEAGPASYPQVKALAAAGPGALREVAATQAQINQAAGGFGSFIGNLLFGGQVTAGRRQVAEAKITLKRDRKDVEYEAKRFGEEVAKQLNGMRVVMDARGVARLVATGTKQNKQHRHGKP